MRTMFGNRYVALSGLRIRAFLRSGLRPTLTNHIPPGLQMVSLNETTYRRVGSNSSRNETEYTPPYLNNHIPPTNG
jgi:hypothetical protein